MLLITPKEANQQQHLGFWICLIHSGLSQETLTLWFRDWIPLLNLGWVHRVSGQSHEVTFHLQRPQCTTESLQQWGMAGVLLASRDTKMRFPGRDFFLVGSLENCLCCFVLRSQSCFVHLLFGLKPTMTLNLDILVRLSYWVISLFLSLSFLVHPSGGHIPVSTRSFYFISCTIILWFLKKFFDN